MTTIATDGESMAGDGMAVDHCETIVNMNRRKVFKLADGRIIGGAGNSFDVAAWREWLEGGKAGDCPIQSEQFGGLILNRDGAVLWVDYKGRETEVPPPSAIGSGQDFAIGAMEAGAAPDIAVAIAAKRDPHSGGDIVVERLDGCGDRLVRLRTREAA